jgi:hypothetical protein
MVMMKRLALWNPHPIHPSFSITSHRVVLQDEGHIDDLAIQAIHHTHQFDQPPKQTHLVLYIFTFSLTKSKSAFLFFRSFSCYQWFMRPRSFSRRVVHGIPITSTLPAFLMLFFLSCLLSLPFSCFSAFASSITRMSFF